MNTHLLDMSVSRTVEVFSGEDLARFGGIGGIAMNQRGTLLAASDVRSGTVVIFPILGSEMQRPGVHFKSGGMRPRLLCFVHRRGVDTLLIGDGGKDQLVEISSEATFLRVLPISTCSITTLHRACAIAYCSSRDVIGVTWAIGDTVLLLDYSSGFSLPQFKIACGDEDGQLCNPSALAFTADGGHVLVADHGNNRVSKFIVPTGEFAGHLIADSPLFPRELLCCEDGRVVVVLEGFGGYVVVVCMDEHGQVSSREEVIADYLTSPICTYSLASYREGIILKARDSGKLLFMRDAWFTSSRHAWVSCLVTL
jgi:hypothetical protein